MTDIACSLSAADHRRRTGEIGDLVRRALGPAEPIRGGVSLRFAPTGAIHRGLQDLVAAESACCPFLTFDLQVQGDELRLNVSGPADAQLVIAEVFARDPGRADLVQTVCAS